MAVYEALPKRFAYVHPRFMTPAFGTMVMGFSALGFYLILTFLSENALLDSVASLGLAVAFYYGITAFSCVWYFRRTLFTSARNLFFRGIFPLLGGLALTVAFGISAKDMIKPDYGYTAFGPLGGVFRITDGLTRDFGEDRVWDSPLAESGIIGTALSVLGLVFALATGSFSASVN